MKKKFLKINLFLIMVILFNLFFFNFCTNKRRLNANFGKENKKILFFVEGEIFYIYDWWGVSFTGLFNTSENRWIWINLFKNQFHDDSISIQLGHVAVIENDILVIRSIKTGKIIDSKIGEIKVCYTLDGEFLISGAKPGKIRVWETKEYKLVKEISLKKENIQKEIFIDDIVINKATKEIIITTHDGDLFILDKITYNIKRVIHDENILLSELKFNPEGNIVMQYGVPNINIKLYSWPSFEKLLETEKVEVSNAEFTPDGKYIIASAHNNIFIYEVETGKKIAKTEKISGFYGNISFSKDGKYFSATDMEKYIIIWDINCNRVEEYKFPKGFAPMKSYLIED